MKAILVIDMPASCKQCRFRDVEGCSVDDCAKNNDGSLVIDRYIYDLKRHGSCPLKPIPQRYDEGIMREQKGWNKCIDEILGGNK